MKIIKEIDALQTFSVRHPVLRPGKSIESCRFDGDNLPTTKHFGLYSNDLLVAVLTILENNSKLFKSKKQYQIRGMAVLIEFQKKGFGEDLIIFAESFIQKKHGDLIWFNARIAAVGFYKKIGFSIIGEAFEIKEVGTHFVMFKKNIQIS